MLGKNPSEGSAFILKTSLMGAAISLALYVPYRYLTHPPSILSLYGFLLPLSPILAAVGIALALRPAYALSLTFPARAAVAAVGTLWMFAGMLCVPRLLGVIAVAPFHGLTALFQMTVQHVFLSLVAISSALAPGAVLARLGVGLPKPGIEAGQVNNPASLKRALSKA